MFEELQRASFACKNLLAARMKRPVFDEILNRFSLLKRGTQLNNRFGPKQAAVQFGVDFALNRRIFDLDKSLNKIGIVFNNRVAKFENVHLAPLAAAQRLRPENGML